MSNCVSQPKIQFDACQVITMNLNEQPKNNTKLYYQHYNDNPANSTVCKLSATSLQINGVLGDFKNQTAFNYANGIDSANFTVNLVRIKHKKKKKKVIKFLIAQVILKKPNWRTHWIIENGYRKLKNYKYIRIKEIPAANYKNVFRFKFKSITDLFSIAVTLLTNIMETFISIKVYEDH